MGRQRQIDSDVVVAVGMVAMGVAVISAIRSLWSHQDQESIGRCQNAITAGQKPLTCTSMGQSWNQRQR